MKPDNLDQLTCKKLREFSEGSVGFSLKWKEGRKMKFKSERVGFLPTKVSGKTWNCLKNSFLVLEPQIL